MSVPSLNKEEALRILLQSGDGMGLADSYALEAALTPRDKEIMEEVVNMSGFSKNYGCMNYLPLVLKIMGEQLQEHELNVEKWNRTMKSFQIEIGLCKEEALKKMVLKSFETLPGLRLRALFLDVALFIVPLSYSDGESYNLDEACLHLSLIHGCKSEEIEFEMQKLQQHGFLTIWKGGPWTPTISVHDFYLEFSASLEEASKYYWSSGLRWSKAQRNQAIKAVGTTQLELRTVVLELDDWYDHFEVPVNFSGVRAMVLRNCKSLKTLLGFANLRSLVSLEICNCPSLKWVEPPATAQNGLEQPYVQRFKWVNQDNKKPNVGMLQQQELETLSSKKAIWRLFWENLPQIGGFKRPLMTGMDGLLLQMKGLQVLRLENTGIRQSVDISRCLPQLRVLEVRELHMKGLRVCNLPNLERVVFVGDVMPPVLWRMDSSTHIWLSAYSELDCDFVQRKRIILGKEFLAGCPKLQEAYMQGVTVEDEANQITLTSSRLKQLSVNGLGNVSRLPDLGACVESLEELNLSYCGELRSLNFGCVFRTLRQLVLQGCENLTEVSGFGGLPMLQILKIWECRSLKTVSGLGDLVSLQEIKVRFCPNLQHCLLADLESLIELRCIDYDERLDVDLSSGKLIGLESLERLERLSLRTPDRSGHSSILVDLATLLGITAPCSFSLNSLSLSELGNLRSLNGIEFLGSLQHLRLDGLQNLSCLRSIKSLGELRSLHMCDCASVEEMPSLSMLAKLQELECVFCKKLRSVEGCDDLDQLQSLLVMQCERLARFPLDLRNWKSSLQELRIQGSKFASGEVVVAWAEDKEVPLLLRRASLIALWPWESPSKTSMCELLVDRVVQKALKRCFDDEEDVDDNNCDTSNKYKHEEDDEIDDGDYDEEVFVAHVSRLAKNFDLKRWNGGWCKLLEEGMSCFAKLPKQCLIDLCQSDAPFIGFLYALFCILCNLPAVLEKDFFLNM